MFDNENDYVMSELASSMASVTEIDWEDNIDFNVPASFSVALSAKDHLNPRSNVAFCNAMSMRGHVSKLSVCIGSCNVFINFNQC